MRMRAIALAAVLLGCGGVQRESQRGVDAADKVGLAGAWDASLSLTQPYQLGGDKPTARRICGTIGFVDNRYGRGPLLGEAEGIGVYDLDLSRLGLNWSEDDYYPTAVATIPLRRRPTANAIDRDSVTIILNLGSSERIVLSGRLDARGIDGGWLAQSLRGTATGSFSLRPHGRAAPAC